MKKIALILSFFLMLLPSFANDPADLTAKAADYYKRGNYSKAAKLYEEIIHNGYISSEIYFNLGNAYFKMDKIPESILNYERAKKLAPGDEDIDYNLNIAYLQIVDKIDPVPKMFLYEWFDRMERSLSSTGWSAVGIAFIWIFFGSLAVFFWFWSAFVKKAAFAVAILSLIVAIAGFTFSATSSNRENTRNEGIIFAQTVYVKSAPDGNSTDLFILHEGTKVRIQDEVDGWKKIRLVNGTVGWVASELVEII